ncbi:MAG: glycosyltransferase [Saprospiraceae bacterium]|nr:glycosyltransferase [Saprospiraceae bacterium]
MKILFPIGTLYPSQHGGPSNTIYWQAKALVKKGMDVTIVTTNLLAEDKVPADVWLDTDYGRVIYHAERSHLFPLKMLRTAWKTLPPCDIVHLNSLFYPPSVIVAWIAMWQKKPIVWSVRGVLDEQALTYGKRRKNILLWLVKRFMASRVCFHSTSEEETNRVRKFFGTTARMVEIPNFMELPAHHAAYSDKPYLLYLGRIHPIKALENLIAALPLSNRFMQSNFTLKIAGDYYNAYGEQLKQQVAALGLGEKVKFLGLVEGEEKQRLYAGAYFSILPSHTENFGNVVIESLAQGTPVIASKGTPWEILEIEKAGFWTGNEPATLAAAIEKALNLPPGAYQIFRENALSLARQRFDIETNIDKWVKAYRYATTLHASQ